MKRIPASQRKWRLEQREKNSRGPTGHWEIVTCEMDGHDQCVVQCIFSHKIAKLICDRHNRKIKRKPAKDDFKFEVGDVKRGREKVIQVLADADSN